MVKLHQPIPAGNAPAASPRTSDAMAPDNDPFLFGIRTRKAIQASPVRSRRRRGFHRVGRDPLPLRSAPDRIRTCVLRFRSLGVKMASSADRLFLRSPLPPRDSYGARFVFGGVRPDTDVHDCLDYFGLVWPQATARNHLHRGSVFPFRPPPQRKSSRAVTRTFGQ